MLLTAISRLKVWLLRKKIERKARREIEKQKIEWFARPSSEKLALGTCEWVHLSWNGKLEEFLINNINVADLSVSGRYPNVIAYFMQLAKQASNDQNDDELDVVDVEKLKEEEQCLYEEVARQSMMSPTFTEVYNSILKMRKERNIEREVKCVRDVIPYDFLQDLFRYHLERWVRGIKKNLNDSTLTV